MKLAVEIVKADDLKPKTQNGSANPFVSVEFQGKRRRTATKLNSLSPCWDETLLFPIADPLDLPQSTIEVSVFHDNSSFSSTAELRNGFLGRVRLSGSSVAPCRLDAAPQLCPLDKRSFFSNVRGELTLRVYVVAEDDDAPANSTVPVLNSVQAEAETVAETSRGIEPLTLKKKRSQVAPAKEKVLREFRSLGTAKDHVLPTNATKVSSKRERRHLPPSPQYYYHASQEQAMPAAPSTVPANPSPPKKTEYELVETRPSLAALLGYLYSKNSDKIKNTYDLVEQMEFLFVRIVSARNLSAPGIAGSLDPYVEVKIGNFTGKTKHRVQSRNPEWEECFAVSKAHLTATRVEVIVKDKSLLMDNSVGKVAVEVADVPVRVPPDGPVAPQWYRLWKVNGDYEDEANRGEIMMSLWNGTQADELYSMAVHSDAAALPSACIPHTRGQVYYSPRMSYLRVKVDSAQDLLTSRPDPEIFVKARFGPQVLDTRASPVRSPNPTWKDEEILLVASEPFDESLVLTVMDRAGNEPLAQVVLGKGAIRSHADHRKPLPSQWFALEKPGGGGGGVYGKIQVACYYDNSYHVIDEAAHFSSDYQPSARPLRRAAIGSLEIGILDAKDLAPQWSNNGSGKSDNATNAYCVAKHGPKWVRTRTILGSAQPWWNEQFSWDVHDPSTVLTVAVFNNSRVDGKNNNGTARDEPLGKIRIRLSTLDVNRVYTHYYPLLAVHPTGVKKTGELHLAVRFTYPSFWFSLLWLYTKPMYNKMHYLHPIPHHQMLLLRHYATLSVAAKLARAEPPLPREAVNYVFDDGSNRFSLRKGRANFLRIQALLADFVDFAKWFDGVRQWNRPLVTVFVHTLFLLLVLEPSLLLPTAFLHLFSVGLWRFKRRPRSPAHADPNLWEWADPDIFDEELDNLPVLTRPPEVVARRYDRLRWVAGNLQEMVGHLANHAERLQALLSWRDPRATAMFAVFALAMAGVLYCVPFQVVVAIFGLHAMRHPKLRSKTPSAAYNFFRRLPGKSDMLL